MRLPPLSYIRTCLSHLIALYAESILAQDAKVGVSKDDRLAGRGLHVMLFSQASC